MNEAEFKQALLRGQGRCLIAVREYPEVYKNAVLWACGHDVAFDPQSEGTRADYVYRIINCYSNVKPFLDEAILALRRKKSDGRWGMKYLAELLNNFADDGYLEARAALWLKYNELYARLLEKCKPNDYFRERDDFESIAIVLSTGRSLFKIAEDIGRMYRERRFLDGSDFEWLWESKGKRQQNNLTELAKTSENVEEYLRKSLKCEREGERSKRKTEKEFPLYVQVKKNVSGAAKKAVKNYLSEMNREERAKALEVFRFSPYPDDPFPVIEDAEFAGGRLRAVALDVLAKIRHPVVREFALENLQTDAKSFLPIFIKNYVSEDEKILLKAVKSISVDFNDRSGWHKIFSCVLDMQGGRNKPPAELLYHIYEKNYCSCCREKAFRQMRKRKLLTDEIISEAVFDCNESIRRLAEADAKKRKEY